MRKESSKACSSFFLNFLDLCACGEIKYWRDMHLEICDWGLRYMQVF